MMPYKQRNVWPKSNRAWPETDKTTLWAMAQEGATLARIAEKLPQHQEDRIRHQLNRMGFSCRDGIVTPLKE